MHRFVLSMVCLLAFSAPALAATRTESPARPVDLIVSTTPSLEGYKIKEYLGIVRGVTVRQPTIGQNLSAGLERLKGGHISAYVTMCETARQQAYDLCLEQARSLKADALVGIAYDSCGFDAKDQVATEVVCYGTAVTVERNVAKNQERETDRVATGATANANGQVDRADATKVETNSVGATAIANRQVDRSDATAKVETSAVGAEPIPAKAPAQAEKRRDRIY